ncbi:hypothetical protein K1719_024270 [Acacia pycnantha]|nr:hypothetical protein K1719_024270 [Acacia pycnantha]
MKHTHRLCAYSRAHRGDESRTHLHFWICKTWMLTNGVGVTNLLAHLYVNGREHFLQRATGMAMEEG